ncbi:MAG: stage V sporulation protein AD [Clostridia bacterium]|nr:stage V sporulation protein AD [Clostridia bacterium]MBQ9506004.1 stage V sporulation protein AD [Clostridia bacterium]
MNRRGKYVVTFPSLPTVISTAACVGKTEGEGPLAEYFDIVNENDGVGSSTWERAEAALVKQAAGLAIQKAGLKTKDIDIAFAGDLLNQCTASTFGLRETEIPLAGLFGACSTFALALIMASVAVDGGLADKALAEASSHFCSAEKQFRYPLEYGGQRTPTAQRTVTGAGAAVIAKERDGVKITHGMVGRVTDYGVTDMANMGAAMAPSAARTIADFLNDTGSRPADFDMILTGDLGSVGSSLLNEVLREEYGFDISRVHADCGNLIFDAEAQDVHAGGSGCGCSASVVCSYILPKMQRKELRKVLFAGTGALMSPLTALQGDTIPAVTHAVMFCS